ncbi:MAG: methylmalonyl-CoA mutase family protein [Planctomycetota bacterium]|jgi:methylmalonyl-CoA mutase, N-terminal domain|nr:methylmalonyl-CoA mutase family protein [Planctomycetota bacterium]
MKTVDTASGDKTQSRPAKFVTWQEAFGAVPQRNAPFETVSCEPVPPLVTEHDVAGLDADTDIGLPGQFPFTRGPYASMYRTRLWTMRQFAGFGSASDTNARFKYLLERGQDGLSVAFDLPTLMGYDADHEHSVGEVGRCGVAVSSLADMETLFDGVPMAEVTTSMTINSPAAIVWAMYLVTAQKQGCKLEQLGGTTQNDILKEYIAQKEYIFPPAPSMRLVVDTMDFAAKHVPRWHPVSISGYHIREAGSTAVQELAFTLADGFAYVEACMERGMDVDSFAPRLSHFFNSHVDFFEEIAKFRAARRIYARRMRDKYGAKSQRSQTLRFHTQTAGCSLTAQQPYNNIVRTTWEALAGVLGGTQSLHTNSMDETFALPTEKAVKIALRTQQLIAYESGVANTIDPLAGSWFVEDLTNRMEQAAEEIFEQIDEMGGVIAAIEKGWFQREIARSAYQYQREVEAGHQVIIGVNHHKEDEQEEEKIDLLEISLDSEREQVARLHKVKSTRSAAKVEESLARIRTDANGSVNLMPAFMQAAEAYVTLGEMTDVLREEFGTYRETPTF